MDTPLLSIVIPTFNRAGMLRDALASLVCQQTQGKFTYEVVVVDNASTDDTRSVVESVRAAVPVRYVYQERPGDAPTRNKGVEEARGSWLAFFDDDQRAEPDWLLGLFTAARQAPSSVVGGAVHLDLSEEELRRLGGICRAALRELKPYRDLHPYDGKSMPGCGNALVARAVFDAIGGFDASMVNGGSDTDFFLRAREAGYTPWYTPRAIIRHRISPSRLTLEYFHWDALQAGDNRATLDFARSSRTMMALLGLARVGQALFVHVPLLIVGWLRRDPGAVLGRKTLIWRAEAYIRKALALLAPKVFPQRSFFESLEFRSGRVFG